ncbi:MAG TPA: transposase [Syntrophobacteraceae bacterium]|nr:transposase [Syntrophobacteraceae bacterium]
MAHQRNLRKGRFSRPGDFTFITTGTKGKDPVFSDTTAATIILDCLKWLNDQSRIHLIAAVVMPDHIHFVARLLNTTLPSLMHSLKSFTANRINERLGRVGPLWEPQYYDHAVRSEDELRECVRYCLENPARKGLIKDFKAYPHWYCVYEV